MNAPGNVVELRYSGGLSLEETAEALKVSTRNREARLGLGEGLVAEGNESERGVMSVDRQQQLKELYNAALERAAGERDRHSSPRLVQAMTSCAANWNRCSIIEAQRRGFIETPLPHIATELFGGSSWQPPS